MISKKILIPVFALVIGGGSLLGVSSLVHAQTGAGPFSGLAHSIAVKFGLSQSDVQTVINSYMQQQRQTMMQNMQMRLQDKLNQEVQQGKITSGQESAILTELSSLKNQFNPGMFTSMNQQQRQQSLQNEKNSLQSWAKSQGINISLIPFGFGIRRGRFGLGPILSSTPTP